jgi:glyoxylase-like metal-dependent hydrolase (beta-lactamase superfamily II)
MLIKKFILGKMETNVYIISNDKKECIIIDPADNGKKIVRYIENEELQLCAILLTHGHFDHIKAVDYIYGIYPCPIYIQQEDMCFLKEPSLNLSHYEIPLVVKAPILPAKDIMEIAGFTVAWVHLPGHTPGSSMLHFINEEVIFSGDVLFRCSIGRFDLPMASHYDTKQTLLKIRDMDFEATVYPGHNESTTLSYEQKNNPYLSDV